MQIVRTTNKNGTYRYEIDGKVQTKAGKVRYTHASSYNTGAVSFHATAAAAAKATGYTHLGWVKTGVYEIVDGDAAPAPAEVPAPKAKAMRKGTKVRVNATYTASTHVGRTGKVVGTNRGDDGNTYVMVDLGGGIPPWPFLASELDRVEAKTPAKAAEAPADAAQAVYTVEANHSGAPVTVRAASMADAIRAVHTESRRPVIADGLTPDSGYTTNVDVDGAHHFIVDEVNAYTVRETPAEAPAAAEAPAKPVAPDYRRGEAVEYRAPGAGGWRAATVESVRVSDNAVMVRRPDGTTDAAPASDVRRAPAPAPRATRDARNAAWRAVVEARLAWRDYPGTKVVTGPDGQPAIHPKALPLAKALAVAEAALEATR